MGCAASAQTRVPYLPAEPRPFDFYGQGPYRSEVPRPATLLGYEPGRFNTGYANYERVVQAMAGKTDRLRIFERGRTPEFRTLYLYAISSPANLARLDEIKANVQRLADPRVALSDAERDALIAKTPVVVWLSYAIHGDEVAAFEAGMQVLYDLVASNDPKITSMLERVVVLMNPAQNPDGHERFAVYNNAHGIGRPERFAFEKRNPWEVSGRLNHYYFDMNRDMIALSQIESQSAAKAFLEWKPQVVADHHGETPSYFFPPAALPINGNLPRGAYEAWLETFGKGNAAAFDRYGWMYFVRDTFDVFYPGYWDSWPSLHGAIGMTYETEGGGKRGFSMLRDDGTEITLRESIAMHVTASHATLQTAAANREARLRDFRAFFVDAVKAGGEGDVRRFVFSASGDPARIGRLLDILLKNGVEVTRTSAAFTVQAAHDYTGAAPAVREFPAGSYVVDLAQPNGRVAKALLELETPQDAAFLARQEAKRVRNEKRGKEAALEEYEFYDITAWALPLAQDVDAWWTAETPAVAGVRVTAVPKPAATAPVRANSAYVFTPETEGGYRLALKLLAEGYRVSAATRPLRAAGRDFVSGTFVVRIDRNATSVHERIAALATEIGVPVTAVDSAYSDQGITGIGSGALVALKRPQIALVAGTPTSPTSYGTLRSVLEKGYGIDFVPVAAETLGQMRLSDFDVVILPDGRAGGYASRLGAGGVAALKAWCEQGGTLICIGGAAEFAAEKGAGLTTATIVGRDGKDGDDAPAPKPKKSEAKPDVAAAEGGAKPAEEPAKPTKPLPVPGAILRAEVDRFHFLSLGYERDVLPMMVEGDVFFSASKTGTNVLTFPSDKDKPLRLAGFVWKGNTEELLRGTAAVIEEPLGDGHVILFANEPGQRLLWQATTRLLMNGVLYGPAINHVATGYRR